MFRAKPEDIHHIFYGINTLTLKGFVKLQLAKEADRLFFFFKKDVEERGWGGIVSLTTTS